MNRYIELVGDAGFAHRAEPQVQARPRHDGQPGLGHHRPAQGRRHHQRHLRLRPGDARPRPDAEGQRAGLRARVADRPGWPSSTRTSSASSSTPSQWQRAFGIAYNAEPEPLGRSFPYAAYKQVRPDDEPAFGYEEIYYQFYLLAIGLQMAGPNLTPESFEAGMFAYPGGSGPRGTWGFGEGDYTPTDDFREIWWDPNRISAQNNQPGAWVRAERRPALLPRPGAGRAGALLPGMTGVAETRRPTTPLAAVRADAREPARLPGASDRCSPSPCSWLLIGAAGADGGARAASCSCPSTRRPRRRATTTVDHDGRSRRDRAGAGRRPAGAASASAVVARLLVLYWVPGSPLPGLGAVGRARPGRDLRVVVRAARRWG